MSNKQRFINVGMAEVATGGGCEALIKSLCDGWELMVTDDAQIPDNETTHVSIGIYHKDGDYIMLNDNATIEQALIICEAIKKSYF